MTLTVNERFARIAAASPKKLSRIDAILTDEDTTSGKPDIDCSTCTYTEAARRLRVSRPTIYRLTKSGRLRTVALNGVSRILISSLIALADK